MSAQQRENRVSWRQHGGAGSMSKRSGSIGSLAYQWHRRDGIIGVISSGIAYNEASAAASASYRSGVSYQLSGINGEDHQHISEENVGGSIIINHSGSIEIKALARNQQKSK